MSDLMQPLPSRRAKRAASEATAQSQVSIGGVPSSLDNTSPSQSAAMPSFGELPSRRALRRAQASVLDSVSSEPGAVPAFPSSAAVPSAVETASTEPDAASASWGVSSTTVGNANVAVKTLHVETFPTGEISGPIGQTGEIILTGPITIPQTHNERALDRSIDAGVDTHQPGIPRRATEALSIIGRGAPIDEKRRIPSVGQGISAGFAAFLGLIVITLIVVAVVTNLV